MTATRARAKELLRQRFDLEISAIGPELSKYEVLGEAETRMLVETYSARDIHPKALFGTILKENLDVDPATLKRALEPSKHH